MSLPGALLTAANPAVDAISSGTGVSGLALQLNAGAIAPEAAVLLALVACLLVDLAGEKAASRWVPPLSYAGLGGSLVLLALQWNPADLQPSFLGSFLADNLAIAFRAVVAASTLITLMLSWRYVERSGTPVGEYAAILLAATLGAMFLCGSTDLVSIFVSLETLSVASYLLSGYMKRDARSSEAALKYLLVGSAAAAVFLYGASLLYGLTGGSTSLEAVGAALETSASPIAALALVFVLATVAFKIAAVPFHQWTPDVYEGWWPSSRWAPRPPASPWPCAFWWAASAASMSSGNCCSPCSRCSAWCWATWWPWPRPR